MDLPIDIKLTANDDGLYDINWTEDGDFEMTNTLETAVLMSINGERRARSYEVATPYLRRGWIGNLVYETDEIEDGSGVWLYQQRRLNTQTLNGVRDESEKGLLWLVADGLAKSVQVSTAPSQGKVLINYLIIVTDVDYLKESITI